MVTRLFALLAVLVDIVRFFCSFFYVQMLPSLPKNFVSSTFFFFSFAELFVAFVYSSLMKVLRQMQSKHFWLQISLCACEQLHVMERNLKLDICLMRDFSWKKKGFSSFSFELNCRGNQSKTRHIKFFSIACWH